MTPRERYETLTDTFASFALDGMLPTVDDVALAHAYIAGDITLDQIIADTVEQYRRP